MTNRLAMNGRPVATKVALAAWDELACDPRVVWIESPPPSHEGYFRRFVSSRTPSPNLWTDAWLAALAESLGLRMTSFDVGFRSFSLVDFECLA